MDPKFEFPIDVEGSETYEQHKGTFEAKTKLSFQETLKIDEIKRSILGPDSLNAAPTAAFRAQQLAFLRVHLIKWPKFWETMEFGQLCEDENLVDAIVNAVVDGKEKLKLARKAKADAAKGGIRDALK